MKKLFFILAFIFSITGYAQTFPGPVFITNNPLMVVDLSGNLLGYIDPSGIIGTGPGTVTLGMRLRTDLTGLTNQNDLEYAQPGAQLNIGSHRITAALRNQWFQDKDGDIAVTSDIPSYKVYSLKGINGVMPGIYTIANMPTPSSGSGDFILTNIKFVIRSMSGGAIVAPKVNIGIAPPLFNDISNMASVNYGVPTPVINTVYQGQYYTNYPILPYGTSLNINVAMPATGATIFTFDVFVIGFFTN